MNIEKSTTTVRNTTKLALTAAILGGITLSAGACKQKSTGISMLRANDSFPAPFSATLSANPSGWSVQIGDSGSITGLTVNETSYVTSATKMPGIAEGAQTAGAMTFTANMNYTFQFNVRKGDGLPVLCETSYAAPLNYSVERAFIKCNGNFNASPNGDSSTPESISDAESDKTMGQYISENTVAIRDALLLNRRSMSPASIARWEALESKVIAILDRYGRNGAGASAEVTYTIQADVKVTDANTVAVALIAAYGGSPSSTDPSPTRKVCFCMVAVCTAGECSAAILQPISSITDPAQCTAKSGTIENSNSDPSSLFNDQMTTTEYSQCSMQ